MEEILNKFIYDNYGFIKLILAKFNLNKEELLQECRYVFYTNDEIQRLLEAGENNKAFTLFASKLRKSSNSMYMGEASSFDAYNKAMKRIGDQLSLVEEMQVPLDDVIISKCECEEIKRLFPYETEFLMIYDSKGSKYCADRYGLKDNHCRMKATRFRRKIRDFLSQKQ